MRHPYHCPYCDQRSTRWWNLQVHIKRKHGGSSDPYLASQPSHQFSYEPTNPYHNIESTTVADNGWNSFQPRYGLQQAPVGISHYYASHPPPTMEDQKYGPGLSRVLKIEELKRLMSKHTQYHENPDGVIRLAVYNSINGDSTLLDDKLQQLRTIDRMAHGTNSFEYVKVLE